MGIIQRLGIDHDPIKPWVWADCLMQAAPLEVVTKRRARRGGAVMATKRYRVTLTRMVVQTATVTVEATTPETAKRRALQIANFKKPPRKGEEEPRWETDWSDSPRAPRVESDDDAADGARPVAGEAGRALMARLYDDAHHETVGRRHRAFGAIYLCTRYIRSQGFWMRLVDGKDNMFDRAKGTETCVSERAIGRTYHTVYDRDSPVVEHEQPCECYVCRGE